MAERIGEYLTTKHNQSDIARQNIEGDITFDGVKNRIDSYYMTTPVRKKDDRTEEADKVSARIAEILSEKTFSFSPVEYLGIHRRLFSGIYKFAGKIRDYNITKQEWVLDGATVFYSLAPLIRETLDYDFREEKNFSYKGLTRQEQVEHITKFISELWQIHPFGEGNTHTVAEMASSLYISVTAVENNIRKLKKGIVSRVGSDKTGHWEIV